MDAVTNYLEKLGSNFLVAAMVPSLGLVVASVLIFNPILQVSKYFELESGISSLIAISLLLAIPTIIIGFTLTALNTYILKLFEGYVFLNRFPFMREAYQKKATRLIIRRESIRRRIDVLERMKKTERVERLLGELKNKYYRVVANYDQSYPPSIVDIQPTKFGNIMKASEAYSGTRYGIDGVPFWTRLLYVIPPTYRQSIDESRNELSFLVNMSILCVGFFILCVFAIIYSFSASIFNLSNIVTFVDVRYIIRYGIAGLAALALNWFFNRASLFSVGDFGAMIRSSYDLFRLDLLEQFRLKQPKDSVEEFQTWKNLGELIVLGQEYLDFVPLKYKIKEKEKKD